MRAAVPSIRGASSVVEQRAQSKAEAEAVKDPTAATRWSERLYTARLEVRTLSAAPNLQNPNPVLGDFYVSVSACMQ